MLEVLKFLRNKLTVLQFFHTRYDHPYPYSNKNSSCFSVLHSPIKTISIANFISGLFFNLQAI